MAAMRPFGRYALSAAGLAVMAFVAGNAQAEFELNWQADGTPPPTSGGCWQSSPDCTIVEVGEDIVPGQTPFIYQRVQQNGQNYYHMVIGDPDSGFAQEVYIQAGGTSLFGQGNRADINLWQQMSSSGGAIDPACDSELGCGQNTNAFDPLSSDPAFSGNASGNPSRVQMRQLLVDGELTVDFVKDRFAEKPVISNIIDAEDLLATFVIDGTGNLYSTAASSPVTNTVQHRGADLPPPESASFDMAVDAPNAHVTAGQYTATNPAAGLPGGPYTYADPLENVNLAPDWRSFFDHSQPNPWTYTDNRPTP